MSDQKKVLPKDFTDIIASLLPKWNELMTGLPPDLSKTTDLGAVALCALSCCINGPVGINNVTDFPSLNKAVAIKDLFLTKISNSGWKELCRMLATALLRDLGKKDCKSIYVLGTYWPLAEWPQTEEQKIAAKEKSIKLKIQRSSTVFSTPSSSSSLNSYSSSTSTSTISSPPSTIKKNF